MNRVAGKVAVVTGAGGGIGSKVSEVLAMEGAAVVAADIDGARAESTAKRITSDGGSAVAVQMDVSREDDNLRLVSECVKVFGQLDIFHANAFGMDTQGREIERDDHFALDISQAVWDGTFATNVRGTWLGCKYAVDQMLTQGTGGAVVATSSIGGLSGHLSATAYGCTKAAINSLMRYIATQYGRRGIRANAVAPAFIQHERVMGITAEWQQYCEDSSLVGRVGTLEDVAYCVLYLASDEASFITGQVITVDGGALYHQPEYADFVRLGYFGQRKLEV
jgi:NAD(P)-dependent dehydrogenase (short-subunit alcohol dehydrogenase family)